MATYGNIPEQLHVILRKSKEHQFYGSPFTAREAFPVSADSEGLLKQAEVWGKGGKYSRQDQEFDKVTVDNTVFHELVLKGIEHRAEGGVAWKVVTPHGWLVDLREPEFLAALFEGCVHTDNGIPDITGNFRWVQNGGQMRLTDTGSDLYKELVKLTALKNSPGAGKVKIKAKDLVVGGVYTSAYYTASNYHAVGFVFLGFAKVHGHRQMTWMNITLKDFPVSAPNRILFLQREFDQGLDPAPSLTLTGACSYTERVGLVDVFRCDKTKYRVFNGYGDAAKPEDLVWL